MGIDRDGRVFRQNLQAFHMVDMVMCNQNGLDVFHAQVILYQSRNDLLGIDTSIHQEAFILLAHIVAIAAAARGKAAKDKRRKAGKEIHLSQIWPQK